MPPPSFAGLKRRFLKHLLLMGIGGACLGTGGLQGQAPIRSGEDFVFSPGDRVLIRVWPDSSLAGVFPVEETGVVHLPLLGARQIEGKTLAEFREELREGYSQDLQLPIVTLEASFRVSVLGAVRSPGVYWVEPSWGVFDLLSESGGFLENAKEDEMVMTRRGGESYRLDARNLTQRGSGESLLALRSGDQLVVPEGGSFNWGIFLQALTLVTTVVSIATR